jgi:hypothetical protein
MLMHASLHALALLSLRWRGAGNAVVGEDLFQAL